MANANDSLSQLSDALGIATARLSGDPQRMQMALGLQQSRKLQEQENKLNQFIGENYSEKEQQLLYAVPFAERAKILMGSQKPESIELLQMVDKDNNFIRNITEKDFVNMQRLGTLPEGAKLTRLPTGTEAAQTKKLSEPSEIFISPEIKPYEEQYDATIRLANAIQSTADQIAKEPTAALALAGGAQFIDAVIQNTKAVVGEYAQQNPDVNTFYEESKKSGTFISETNRDFGERIREVSQGNALLESKIRDLAYLFAAARGQEGRGLSDKDYENALDIVSGGVGAQGKMAVLSEVHNRITGEVTTSLNNQKTRLDYRAKQNPERQEDFNKYITEIDSIFATPLPTFSNPFAQQAPSTTGETPRVRIKL